MTAIFFAISITAILAVVGLVLGGSIGYTAARNAQTAADSAALAGAAALQKHKQDWVAMPADKVLQEVESVVTNNGAVLGTDDCHLVDAEYAITGAESDVRGTCDQLGYLSPEAFEAVAGIRVRVSDTRGVPFSAFVGGDSITGGAVAAATIQPVTSGRSPFMVCTSPKAVGHPAQALVPITDAHGNVIDYEVNQAALGKYYVLWGNQIKEHESGRDCGNPNSKWRGLVQFGSTFSIPSLDVPTSDNPWWGTESGNTSGGLDQTLAGSNACTFADGKIESIKVNCLISVPLCPAGNGVESDFRLYCVAMGAFRISHVGSTFDLSDETPEPEAGNPCGTVTSNIICGEFLGAATAASGRGSAETPDAHGVSVIKLVQ